MFYLPQSVTKECQADIKPSILSVTLCSIKLIEEVFELLEYFSLMLVFGLKLSDSCIFSSACFHLYSMFLEYIRLH